MKNQLYLAKKTVRLNCIWSPTGDLRRPLSCAWVAVRQPAVSIAILEDIAMRFDQCA
jgi:hypothetical protein